MSEDFCFRRCQENGLPNQVPTYEDFGQAYYSIEDEVILLRNNSLINLFGIPLPTNSNNVLIPRRQNIDANPEIIEQLSYVVEEQQQIFNDSYHSMNADQKIALDGILPTIDAYMEDTLDHNLLRRKVFFINANGGNRQDLCYECHISLYTFKT